MQPELPDDVVLEIFMQLTDHTNLFNPSLSSSSSAWSRALNQKKTIVLVCKQWYSLGTPFLYKQVVLRRNTQLASLLRTLKIVPDRGCHIVEFTVTDTFYIPNGRVLKNVEASLSTVFSLCPKLIAVNIRPSFQILDCINIPSVLIAISGPIEDPGNDSSFSQEMREKLEQLELGSTYHPRYQLRVLGPDLTGRLRSLTLSILASDRWLITQIDLPCLEDLQLLLGRGPLPFRVIPSPRVTLTLPTNWSLPSLRSLRINIHTKVTAHQSILSFVKSHGLKLVHFGIHHSDGRHVDTSMTRIQDYIKCCPEVKHLSLDYATDGEQLSQTIGQIYSHVDHLDLYSVRGTPSPNDALIKYLIWLPSLRTITFFSEFRVENLFTPPVPYLIDPIHVLEDAWSWLRPGDGGIGSGRAEPACDDRKSVQINIVCSASADSSNAESWRPSSPDFDSDGDFEYEDGSESDTGSDCSQSDDDVVLNMSLEMNDMCNL